MATRTMDVSGRRGESFRAGGHHTRHIMLIVMKYGGTSVGSAERIKQAAELSIASAREGHQVVVVTSAMSGVTNLLIDAARAAAGGRYDSQVRQQLFDRHKAVADALVTDQDRRRAALEQIDERLE